MSLMGCARWFNVGCIFFGSTGVSPVLLSVRRPEDTGETPVLPHKVIRQAKSDGSPSHSEIHPSRPDRDHYLGYPHAVSTNKKQATEPSGDLSYEQALEKVEAIADRIESGEIGIEEAVAEYENAMALIKRCRTILNRAEQKITALTLDDEASADNDS